MSIESQILNLIRRESKKIINDKLSNSLAILMRDTGLYDKVEKMAEKKLKDCIRSYSFRREVEEIVEEAVRKFLFDRETLEHLIEILRARVKVRRKPIGIRINEILQENPNIERKELKKQLLLEGYHPNYIDSALGAFFTK